MRGTLLRYSVLLTLAGGGVVGCEDSSTGPVDREAPAVPRGLGSITGDHQVTLLWYPNGEYDLHGYRVYRNDRPSGRYERIAWVPDQNGEYIRFVDRDLLNGLTYYYTVSAVDYSGNESQLSPEEVYDTPRPEGYGLVLTNYYDRPGLCAYDFSDYMVTDYDDPLADIAYLYEGETGAWMIGLNEPDTDIYTEIQDAGYTRDLDEVSYAPVDGWAPRAMVELVEGHAYVVWTRDYHYAKFRVTHLRPSDVELDWAYQVAPENRELREGPAVFPSDGPKLPPRSAKARARTAG